MKRKIIIAEDSLTIQRVFELAFIRSDYQVTYVDRGQELKSMALELNPALIICDLSLPDIDGYEVVSELKKEPSLLPVPVILLAGSIEPFDEERYKNSGADGVLFKPFDSQELVDKVEEMMREKSEASGVVGKGEEKMSEEGWDFSDVFEEVELGVESGEELTSEESFMAELVSDTDLPEVESVGEYDVGVDELELIEKEDAGDLEVAEDIDVGEMGEELAPGEATGIEEGIPGGLEVAAGVDVGDVGVPEEAPSDEITGTEEVVPGDLEVPEEVSTDASDMVTEEAYEEIGQAESITEEEAERDVEEDEDLKAIDELVDDLEMGELEELGEVDKGVPEDPESELVESILSEEPGEEIQPSDPPTLEMFEEDDLEEVATVDSEEPEPKMDEEDRMMEEIVRDVEEFPISTGYDSHPHKIMKQADIPGDVMNGEKKEYEDMLGEVFSSDQFRNELTGRMGEITEKILWEVMPSMMEDLKGEIISVIKEISASVVPDIAGKIIQEEIKRIKEEVEPGD